MATFPQKLKDKQDLKCFLQSVKMNMALSYFEGPISTNFIYIYIYIFPEVQSLVHDGVNSFFFFLFPFFFNFILL